MALRDKYGCDGNLRNRFGLTGAETGLATEILKGDGRAAAARRLGTVATARAQLSGIFEKTGTAVRPNLSISCSNSPTNESLEYVSSDHVSATKRGVL